MKKIKKQSKFEAIDNKLKLYTNERDRVADKLIGRYEEKLKPMEAELERLQNFNNKIDLMVVAAEVKIKSFLISLTILKKKRSNSRNFVQDRDVQKKD